MNLKYPILNMHAVFIFFVVLMAAHEMMAFQCLTGNVCKRRVSMKIQRWHLSPIYRLLSFHRRFWYCKEKSKCSYTKRVRVLKPTPYYATEWITIFDCCPNYKKKDGECIAVTESAICRLKPNPELPLEKQQPIRGTVKFYQKSQDDDVRVTLQISGLKIDHDRLRGMHVHHSGNVTNGCSKARGHYNPHGSKHGSHRSSERHPGDFGNILFSKDGIAYSIFSVQSLTLYGNHTAIGRSIVLHGEEDDLGRGNNTGSTLHGNSGPRIACCTIEAV